MYDTYCFTFSDFFSNLKEKEIEEYIPYIAKITSFSEDIVRRKYKEWKEEK